MFEGIYQEYLENQNLDDIRGDHAKALACGFKDGWHSFGNRRVTGFDVYKHYCFLRYVVDNIGLEEGKDMTIDSFSILTDIGAKVLCDSYGICDTIPYDEIEDAFFKISKYKHPHNINHRNMLKNDVGNYRPHLLLEDDGQNIKVDLWGWEDHVYSWVMEKMGNRII